MLVTPTVEGRPKVGLLVTCLVDFFRPVVAHAAIELLERAGCRVEVPLAQTCCGQPGIDSGERRATAGIARATIALFERFDYVVIPSGSCAAFVRNYYASLLDGDPAAQRLAERTYELTSFLTDVRGMTAVDSTCAAKATYHDACNGLRALHVKQQPRALLRSVRGLELAEMSDPEICCGFGGTFCVKYDAVSTDMVTKKTTQVRDTGATLALSGDMGCLLNIAGRLKREESTIEVRHVAEVLAGKLHVPGIGDSR